MVKELECMFRLEVFEETLPKKLNWLDMTEEEYEEFDEDNFPKKGYELYFATWEEMSQKIDEITKGYHMFWCDPVKDHMGNDTEFLEYHNDQGAWDKEIHITTSRVYLTESFWKAVAYHQNKK